MQTPPDLAQALATNPAAASTFDQLDAANRYAIVYRLNAVKRPTTRDRRLAEYVDMLARGESLHPRKDPSVTVPVPPNAEGVTCTAVRNLSGLVETMVVLRCHKAKPFAEVVDGPPMLLPAPNIVLRSGTGDR
jgi:Bacteriocin-protection, YdeI or OmpD-Associated